MLEDASGEKLDVWIGRQSDFDERRFVRTSSKSGIYLAEFDTHYLSYDDPYALIALDAVYFFDQEAILSVTVKDKAGTVLYDMPYIADDTLETWAFLGSVQLVSPGDVQAYRPTDDQLAAWLLDDPLVVTVRFLENVNGTSLEHETSCRFGLIENGHIYMQLDRIAYLVPIDPASVAVALFDELRKDAQNDG